MKKRKRERWWTAMDIARECNFITHMTCTINLNKREFGKKDMSAQRGSRKKGKEYVVEN